MSKAINNDFKYTLCYENREIIIAKGSIVKIFGQSYENNTTSKLPMEYELKNDITLSINDRETKLAEVHAALKPVKNIKEVQKVNLEFLKKELFKRRKEVIAQWEETLKFEKERVARTEKRLQEWKEEWGNK